MPDANGAISRAFDETTNSFRFQGTVGGAVATAGTATLSNVNDSATSVTVLAANTSRKGVVIHNDSSQALKLKYGATASATSYTVEIAAEGYWEMPSPIYTGVLDGIWDADGSGAARITELT